MLYRVAKVIEKRGGLCGYWSFFYGLSLCSIYMENRLDFEKRWKSYFRRYCRKLYKQ
jgi:hypothetical protein